MAGGVFISYRREDSGGSARSIYDRLRKQLGENNVFIDVIDINIGLDWTERLELAIGSCDVLIAVIGRDWISCLDESKTRRLDKDNDYVRFEIRTALMRNIPVVPVLVERAIMPSATELPDDLRKLPYRQGFTVTVERLDSDVAALAVELETILTKNREHEKWLRIAEEDSKSNCMPSDEKIIHLVEVVNKEFKSVTS